MYNQNDDNEPVVLPDSVIELEDMIEFYFDNPPKDRRKRREVEQWVTQLNSLINKVNTLTDVPVYKKVKI